MLILALETSGMAGSVALVEGAQEWSQSLAASTRSAQGLAPAIAQVLQAAHKQPAELDLLAVTEGPGSFTGLRVGVMTAKTMAYALQKPCLGINTLDLIAAQGFSELPPDGRLWAILDAQRRQLFAASYLVEKGQLRCLQPTAIWDIAAWLSSLAPNDAVTGPAIAALEGRLTALPAVRIVEEQQWAPRAMTVARLAEQAYAERPRDDAGTLVPQYYRLSAAEEKARLQSKAV